VTPPDSPARGARALNVACAAGCPSERSVWPARTSQQGQSNVGFGLWAAYGVASHDLPPVVPNTVAFVVVTYTIGVARRYR
jgi:hypothetical protein